MGDTSPLAALQSIDRRTTWTLEGTTQVHADIGHPQGLTSRSDGWLISTVHPRARRGEILVVGTDGEVAHRLDVTFGSRFHPGGVHWSRSNHSAWIPVAEYRPHSSTTVVLVDEDLAIVEQFDFDDHLGAVCELDDGSLFAVSWGSRDFYRLSPTGRILDRRSNPSHFVDHQDLHVEPLGIVIASGVADVPTRDGSTHMGGLAVIDAVEMRLLHEVPVTATMPSGRSITYNGFEVESTAHPLRFHCIVDDDRASIGHWSAC